MLPCWIVTGATCLLVRPLFRPLLCKFHLNSSVSVSYKTCGHEVLYLSKCLEPVFPFARSRHRPRQRRCRSSDEFRGLFSIQYFQHSSSNAFCECRYVLGQEMPHCWRFVKSNPKRRQIQTRKINHYVAASPQTTGFSCRTVTAAHCPLTRGARYIFRVIERVFKVFEFIHFVFL